MAQKAMHKIGEWVIETVLGDTLRVSAEQMYDNRQGRTLLVFVAMIALLVYTILEMPCREAAQSITARQVLERFERLGVAYLQFGDGSVLKLPSALNAFRGQLIELLRFPDPAVHLSPQEAES
jgi:hypothetical protein